MKIRVAVSLVNRPTALALVDKIKSSYQLGHSSRHSSLRSCACSEKKCFYSSPTPPPPLPNGMLVHRRVNLPVLYIHTPDGREVLRGLKCLVQKYSTMSLASDFNHQVTEPPMRWTGGKPFCLAVAHIA